MGPPSLNHPAVAAFIRPRVALKNDRATSARERVESWLGCPCCSLFFGQPTNFPLARRMLADAGMSVKRPSDGEDSPHPGAPWPLVNDRSEKGSWSGLPCEWPR